MEQQLDLWKDTTIEVTLDNFTPEEIASLLYLQQWYLTGGSDQASILRYWEFLRMPVRTGKMEP